VQRYIDEGEEKKVPAVMKQFRNKYNFYMVDNLKATLQMKASWARGAKNLHLVGTSLSNDIVIQDVAPDTDWVPKNYRQLVTIILYRGTTLYKVLGLSKGWVHDLGDGTYFTTSCKVAEEYAELRSSAKELGVVLRAEVGVNQLGRVLNLTEGPLRERWEHLVAPILKNIPKMSGEPYRNALEGLLEELKLRLDDFDTVIGPDYVRGGIQVNIQNQAILDQILSISQEIKSGIP
jgi:hypothetical protein